jgi:hypothetical protein
MTLLGTDLPALPDGDSTKPERSPAASASGTAAPQPGELDLLWRRYQWALAVSNSREAGGLLLEIDALQPGARGEQLPVLIGAIHRDYGAIMAQQDADAAVVLGDLILSLALDVHWMLFNLGTLCQTSGRRNAAARFYKGCIDSGAEANIASGAATNLAFILAGGGRFSEAVSYLERGSSMLNYAQALRTIGQYERAAAELTRQFENSAKRSEDYQQAFSGLLECGKLAQAVALAASAPADARGSSVDYLQRLYGHVHKRVVEIEAESAHTAGVLGMVVCWGETYVRNFLRVTLPCLLHPSNLPALSRHKPVELRIHTDTLGRMLFRGDARMKTLEKHVKVSYEIIPPELLLFPPDGDVGPQYRLFGALWHLAVIEARATGRDVFAIGADVVYSTGSWGYVGDLAAAGHEVIFAQSLSTLSPGMEAALLAHLDAQGCIAIGPREIMELAFRHLHPRTLGGFVSPENRFASGNLTYLYFPTEEGLNHRVLAPGPLYLQHSALRADAIFNFLTNDGEFMDRLLPDPGDWERIYHIADNDHYCSVELSLPEKNTGEGNPGLITPRNICGFADKFRHLRMMRRMFEVEYRFRGTKPQVWKVADASAFIAETRRMLNES